MVSWEEETTEMGRIDKSLRKEVKRKDEVECREEKRKSAMRGENKDFGDGVEGDE